MVLFPNITGKRWRVFPFVREPDHSALILHYLSLIAAGLLLLYWGRKQWFFGDDWSFIGESFWSTLWQPHNGHWSTIPFVTFYVLVKLFGVVSFPFSVVFVLTHCALVHLLWRMLLLVKVNIWVSTFGAMVLLLLGPGYENIIWFFQIGFVLSLFFPLSAVLLIIRETNPTPLRKILVSLLILGGLASSGTAVPLLLPVLFIAARNWGFRNALGIAILPTLSYLVWFITQNSSAPSRSISVTELFVQVPQYAATMITEAYGNLFPNQVFGYGFLVLLVAWIFVVGLRNLEVTFLPLMLATGALIFAILTGFARYGLGMEYASSSRYLYVVLMLSWPIALFAISHTISHKRVVISGISISLAVLAAYNAGSLHVHMLARQSASQESKQKIIQAVIYDFSTGRQISPEVQVEPEWAPDLTIGRLRALIDQKLLVVP